MLYIISCRMQGEIPRFRCVFVFSPGCLDEDPTGERLREVEWVASLQPGALWPLTSGSAAIWVGQPVPIQVP